MYVCMCTGKVGKDTQNCQLRIPTKVGIAREEQRSKAQKRTLTFYFLYFCIIKISSDKHILIIFKLIRIS